MYKFAVTTSLDAHSSWCVWGGRCVDVDRRYLENAATRFESPLCHTPVSSGVLRQGLAAACWPAATRECSEPIGASLCYLRALEG